MRFFQYGRAAAIGMAAVLSFAAVAVASDVDVAVVDVTAPTDAVTLAAGGSASITINMSVTGNQAGTATFEVYRDWNLTDGTFSGSNPQEFTVAPRAGGDPPTNFSTTGNVSVAADQVDGDFTLEVGAFDITNSNPTGAKLAAGASSNYAVTVETPVPSDTTPPVITLATPADGATYFLDEVVNADYTCTDNESTVSQCEGTVASGAAIDTSSVGAKTFTVETASAGGATSLSHSYSVVYDFAGFFRPIDNGGVFNAVKAGSAVPVKFSLSGDQGLEIMAEGSPSSRMITCDASAPSDVVEETVTAGKSSLSYDLSTDTYNYVWKTDKAWAGTCRQLTVKLIDGTSHTANFKLNR